MFPRIVQIPLPFELGGSEYLTIYSFGAMMAIAFLVAAWIARRELDRLHAIGRLPSVRIALPSQKARKGSKEFRKKRMTDASPGHLMGSVTVIAVVAGIAGAKIFHILENLDDFFMDPVAMIFSQGGLTFYGGLLVAAVAISWFMHKKGIPLALFADILLPVVMLAYGIGRLGCHLAGDGDWGIASDPASRPAWIPTWLWGETYPNNILQQTLPESGVYPTPLYEFGMALIFFTLLWTLRNHPFKPGWLFSLTLVFFGIERLLIEQIRINNTFELFGLTITQAEFISVVLIVAGIVGLVLTTRNRNNTSTNESG